MEVDVSISNPPGEDVMMGAMGVIGEMSPEDAAAALELIERELAEAREKQESIYSKLAAEDMQAFRQRAAARSPKEGEWTRCQELYLGKLSTPTYRNMYPENDAQRSAAKDGLPPLRVNIIKPKVKTAVSQMVSSQFGGGEKNWNLLAPKNPVIDTNVDSNNSVKLMEGYIEDQLEATDYVSETKASMYDWAILGTGILKGPVNSGKMKKIWAQQQMPDGSIVRIPQMTLEYVPGLKRVDPWMFYPDLTVKKIKDAEDAIEIHAYSKLKMEKLKKHPGYRSEAIAEILEEDAPTFMADSTYRGTGSFLNSELFKDKYLVIERYRRIERDCLCEMGVDIGGTDEEAESLWCEMWSCNGKVIRIELSNLETMDSVPYAVDTWEEDPSSIFGFGLPLINEDQQRVAEGMWDVIVDNAKISSGPQVVIDRTVIEPSKGGGYDIEPWKVWLSKQFGADAQAAIQFAEVPNRQQELSNVLEMAKNFADEEAGIPLLAGGMEGPQLTSGATGMALMAKQGTSVLHEKAQQWDDNITDRVIEWMYDWNMQYNQDESAKGSYEVDVRKSTSYLRQHMEIINAEKILAQTAQNPVLTKYVKVDELVKSILANMQLPSTKLVRNEEEATQWEQEQQQKNQPPPDPAVLKIEVDKQRLEIEKERIALEREKLAWEREQGQMRAQMEYEAKQEANDARVVEAQSSLQGKQIERDTEMIKLGAKQQVEYAKIQADANIRERDLAVKEFTAGAKLELDANKQALTKEEMELRRTTGQGI